MRKVLLFLWQLPQNLLGLVVIFVTQAKFMNMGCWVTTKSRFGVSLGKYIIFGQVVDDISFMHEQGHQKQSLYLGPLYLLLIGLPSSLFNLYDRLFHKSWTYQKRYYWYYALPWEAWADRLGGVVR